MKLQVIVGATRQGRVTDKLAKWVSTEAAHLPDTQVEVVDLADYPMPFFDEAISPQYNPDRKPEPAVKKWLDKLNEADAFIIVTPEYNRSMSGVLKNALDYLDFQFAHKAIGIVAHGSTGGAQAVASLRLALPGTLAVVVPQATFFSGRPGEMLDDTGDFVDESVKANPYGPQGALKTTLEQTKWLSDALSSARSKDVPAS